MACYGAIAVAVGHLYGFKRFGERSYLVHFNEDGIARSELYAFLEEFGVCYEQIVAYQLASVADGACEFCPAFPVVFVKTVFDGVDGVFCFQLLHRV